MKHFLQTLILVACTSFATAQITVTSLDLNIGDQVLQVSDDNYTTDLYEPGTNLVWDFSGLHGLWTDTIAPIAPDLTSYASSFPDANIAIGTIDLSAYLSNTNAGFVMLGYGGTIEELGQDAELVNSVPDTLVSFPLNYGDTKIYNSWGISSILTVQDYTGKISQSIQRTQNCDAWGTVTTPEGTYDALRVQEETITIDSIFVVVEIPYVGTVVTPIDSLHQFDTTYVYKFYTNDPEIKIPLLEVEYVPSTNDIISTKWVKFPDDVSVYDIEKTTLNIYPNPANDYINITSDSEIIDFKIYNSNGQVVKQGHSKKIDIIDLPSSIYFIELNSTEGISRQKLIVK